MVSKLEDKLQELPKQPGVYLYKNRQGKIIYVGKAAVLRNRVRQYFQKSRTPDPKTEALVADVVDVDWITVESEMDALFLEAELVRRYKPRYNILLRDDKSTAYVRIDYKSDHPTVTITRRPLDDGAEYFGPYFNANSVRRALHYLRRPFPYSTHTNAIPKRACLQYHLGLCPGLEENKTSLEDYRAMLKKLMQYLRGERVKLIRGIEKDMKTAAQDQDFEQAATLRNQLHALKGLSKQIIFSDREFMDISKDEGLMGLTELLGLPKPPRRIEGYDISHMNGTDNVASMVVFTNGLPNKAEYRKFKMRLPGNNDFAHMNEAITRRLQHVPRPSQADDGQGAGEERTKPYTKYDEGVPQPATQSSAASASGVSGSARKQTRAMRESWGVPDLFLIDGGKGQLSAALDARDKAGFDQIPMIGLAKREEEVVVHNVRSIPGGQHQKQNGEFSLFLLPKSSHTVKLLQRIRDESHRFAVSYHSVLKRQRQTSSFLDGIPTVGPATRKKLLKTFGSVKGIMQARQIELEKLLGVKKATILRQYIRAHKNDRL